MAGCLGGCLAVWLSGWPGVVRVLVRSELTTVETTLHTQDNNSAASNTLGQSVWYDDSFAQGSSGEPSNEVPLDGIGGLSARGKNKQHHELSDFRGTVMDTTPRKEGGVGLAPRGAMGATAFVSATS